MDCSPLNSRGRGASQLLAWSPLYGLYICDELPCINDGWSIHLRSVTTRGRSIVTKVGWYILAGQVGSIWIRRATLREHWLAKSVVLHAAFCFFVARDGPRHITGSSVLNLVSFLVNHRWADNITLEMSWRIENDLFFPWSRDHMCVVVNPDYILRTRIKLSEGKSSKHITQLWALIIQSLTVSITALLRSFTGTWGRQIIRFARQARHEVPSTTMHWRKNLVMLYVHVCTCGR